MLPLFFAGAVYLIASFPYDPCTHPYACQLACPPYHASLPTIRPPGLPTKIPGARLLSASSITHFPHHPLVGAGVASEAVSRMMALGVAGSLHSGTWARDVTVEHALWCCPQKQKTIHILLECWRLYSIPFPQTRPHPSPLLSWAR